MNINLNEVNLDYEQKRALEIMLSDRNVFLTSKGGCGKSFIINEFKSLCLKNLICMAPTGVAAQNIDGATIHSIFGFPTGIITSSMISKLRDEMKPERAEILRVTEVFLIDEVSMVRADLFMAMDEMLREIMQNNMPFGGKQIIVCGDFFQLTPVVTKDQGKIFWKLFDSVFAFTTSAWKQAEFTNICLKKVYRQSEQDFLAALDVIRTGSVELGSKHSLNDYLEMINQHCCVIDTAENAEEIVISCRKSSVNELNNYKISSLPGLGIRYQAIKYGFFPSDMLPVSPELIIKKGEKVMLVENKYDSFGQFEYINGSTGVVEDYCDGDMPCVLVRLQNGQTVKLKRKMWIYSEYQLKDGELTTKDVGWYQQFPLLPAYAITIHKSQGKTLECAHFDLRYSCFCSGQLYVGMSRIRSMRGLTISHRIAEKDIIVSPEVLNFYRYLNYL